MSIIGNITKRFDIHTDWIKSLAVLPDGTLASASIDRTIKILDIVTGNELKTLNSYSAPLAALLDGTLASSYFTWDNGADIKIWDIVTGNNIKTLRGHTNGVDSLAVLPDGTLASGSYRTILIWE
jgi:WD40 repeat protein